MQDMIDQLTDSRSAKRRSAAKKIRKTCDIQHGPPLLEALKKEVGDVRTWETQYEMIMALGACGFSESKPFLEKLAAEDRVEMVRIALGDALLRFSGGLEGNFAYVGELITRNDDELIHGAFQAMAMERVVPEDEKVIEDIIHYGCSLQLGENDWAVIWLLRTVPGWPKTQVEPLLSHWSAVTFRENQQIHAAVELARQRKYGKWSPA